eukprot:GHUV01051294.1.p1 GENE.GHUV01051294.1~~GHUV01051294.1.p1  ORF type:complete len:126 (-),score=35.41 GHUV01051294.1:228-605(-)
MLLCTRFSALQRRTCLRVYAAIDQHHLLNRRNKQQTATATARSDKTSLSAALEPRNWSQQAADITDNLLDVSKYKSLAVYAEVKLAEALDRAAKVQPDTVNEDGELLPNSLKTAVCFQVHEESKT